MHPASKRLRKEKSDTTCTYDFFTVPNAQDTTIVDRIPVAMLTAVSKVPNEQDTTIVDRLIVINTKINFG